MMKLVEASAGLGDLVRDGQVIRQVRYQISRFQGMLEGSGMPIPGLYRIEGSIDFDADRDGPELVGTPLTLRLERGSAIGITLADSRGRILAEGHGPMKCSCC